MSTIDEQQEPPSQAAIEFSQKLRMKLSPEDRARMDTYFDPAHRSTATREEMIEFLKEQGFSEADLEGF